MLNFGDLAGFGAIFSKSTRFVLRFGSSWDEWSVKECVVRFSNSCTSDYLCTKSDNQTFMAKIENRKKQNPKAPAIGIERRTCKPLPWILYRSHWNSRDWRGRQSGVLHRRSDGRETEVQNQAHSQEREAQPLYLVAPSNLAGAST